MPISSQNTFAKKIPDKEQISKDSKVLKDTFAVKAIEIEGIKHIAVTKEQAKTIAKDLELKSYFENQFKQSQEANNLLQTAISLKDYQITEKENQINLCRELITLKDSQYNSLNTINESQNNLIRQYKRKTKILRFSTVGLSIIGASTVGILAFR